VTTANSQKNRANTIAMKRLLSGHRASSTISRNSAGR